MTPQRIQQRRVKGWRKPENTVSVARPGKWGNPFRIGHPARVVTSTGVIVDLADARYVPVRDARDAVELFEDAILGRIRVIGFQVPSIAEVRALRGKNLMCFCPPDRPCHADILLELANS